MNIVQQKKILVRIQTLQSDIETLKRVLVDLASSEYVSATLASSGGSKSYTRRNISDVKEALVILRDELRQTRKLLRNESGLAPETIATIYS